MSAPACECPERDWKCKGCWAQYRRERRAAGKDLVIRIGDKTTTQASVERMLRGKSRRT